MRWGIRYQLLVPLALLLPGLVGVCTWTALDSARLARRRIAEQVDSVAQTMSGAHFPLTEHILEMMRGLSGADYLVVEPGGGRGRSPAATSARCRCRTPMTSCATWPDPSMTWQRSWPFTRRRSPGRSASGCWGRSPAASPTNCETRSPAQSWPYNFTPSRAG